MREREKLFERDFEEQAYKMMSNKQTV